jgi:hypothetical protein
MAATAYPAASSLTPGVIGTEQGWWKTANVFTKGVGGAIRLAEGTIDFDTVRIKGCAADVTGSWVEGGAIFGSSATSNLKDIDFQWNQVAGHGGAVSIQGATITMESGKISNNRDIFGFGGVFLYGGGNANTFYLKGGEITANASYGVYLDGTLNKFIMTGGKVTGNTVANVQDLSRPAVTIPLDTTMAAYASIPALGPITWHQFVWAGTTVTGALAAVPELAILQAFNGDGSAIDGTTAP